MSYLMVCSVCVLFLFVGVLLFSDGNMTGLATVSIFEKKLDFFIDTSQSFRVKGEGGLRLTSITVEGEVIGAGTVEIVLDNKKGGKRRIFLNGGRTQFIPKHGLVSVTAQIEVEPAHLLAEQPQESVSPQEGVFVSCDEACSFVPAWDEEEYLLSVYVDSGTSVILKKIVYTS